MLPGSLVHILVVRNRFRGAFDRMTVRGSMARPVRAPCGCTTKPIPDRTPRVSGGPEWAAREETQPAPDTLRDRPGLSSRDRDKLGPSGEKQRPAERIDAATVRWGGCFVVCLAKTAFNRS